VEAMVGSSILDMASLDPSSRDFNSRTEKAVKMMSMANLLDHSNAMVQNHLANHYFWKWTPVGGSVQVAHGSNLVQGTQALDILPGERIRIGTEFETQVSEETEEEEDNTRVRIRDPWKGSAKST
jgi:RNA polymerase-associated protein CTR9